MPHARGKKKDETAAAYAKRSQAAHSYKFDKAADEKVRGQMAAQFGTDPTGGVVRAGTFKARRDEQIRRRKAMEKRRKISSMRAGY